DVPITFSSRNDHIRLGTLTVLRTGSLIVSYLLMRAGLPPFVLSLENAEGYFNPSSVIRNSAKHGVKALYELPKIKKKYAAFLEAHAPAPETFFLPTPLRERSLR
ncbi:hypothetical protein ACQKIS_22200, partial [Pseudomonas fulva]